MFYTRRHLKVQIRRQKLSCKTNCLLQNFLGHLDHQLLLSAHTKKKKKKTSKRSRASAGLYVNLSGLLNAELHKPDCYQYYLFFLSLQQNISKILKEQWVYFGSHFEVMVYPRGKTWSQIVESTPHCIMSRELNAVLSLLSQLFLPSSGLWHIKSTLFTLVQS